ncbi:SAG-related sequence [Besnoitia besnoiti]|uniref:SAG-related sequence n=1 Tax=Besnoitia besnoiti TaxID=94643 RepID=A0A2A9MEP7_BESBE|nr:SAG-related sequence [Besnoitia besnoiti]PFH33862.1 SAG-related sequence [Besnoitia besnoiti]
MMKTAGEQRRGSFNPKACAAVALCLWAVLLLTGEQVRAEKMRDVSRHRDVPENPEEADSLRTCESQKQTDAAHAPPPLALSKENLSATLKCSGDSNKFVPEGEGTKVCSGDGATDVKACTAEKYVDLQGLLGTTEPVKWTKKGTTKAQEEVWTLQLDESHLPLSDTTFFVGCQNGGKESKCKLDITVQARASSVESNVAKCAYGQHSNPQPLLVELTPQNNTLTLECGKDHPIEPNNHTTYYCEDEKMKACTKTFKDILPNFDASWWSKTDETNNHVKLEIPPTEFPSADQQFYIGCSAESVAEKPFTSLSKTNAAPPAKLSPSPCRVHVLVKAGSSSFAKLIVQTAATVTGSAVLVGLLPWIV